MKQMGTYDELLESSPTFAQLLEDINQNKLEHQSVSYATQQSVISTLNSEKGDDDEDTNLPPTNLETKPEGTVKRDVYVSYIRAGVGIVLGPLLIFIVFSTQQAVAIYSNWWLAKWTNDESRRYQNQTNCMNISNKASDEVYLMSDVEWKRHQTQRFYIFAGLTIFFSFITDLDLYFSSCYGTLPTDITSPGSFTVYMFKCCTDTS
jgi:hypothetical protein